MDKQWRCFCSDFTDLNGNKAHSFLCKENFIKTLNSTESRTNSSNKRNENLLLYVMEWKGKAG